ncbi:hypothetical protein M9458_051446, partial [Cirrhinus mrigala]
MRYAEVNWLTEILPEIQSTGEQVGYENISSVSRMNKAVVGFFLKEEIVVNRLVSRRISVSGLFVAISPLVNPTRKVIISNVPPFIPDDDIERALLCYGKSTCPHKAGSSDVNTTPNSTDDSEARESNREKTTLNENSTVDLVANESNGGQTTPIVNSVDSVANESTVRQITPKVNSTVVLEMRETLGSETCKDSEVVQMNEVVSVEINKMMSCTEMVREEGIGDDDMLSDLFEIWSQ